MKPALRSPPAETLCMLDIMLIYHKKDKHVNVLRPPFRGRGPRSGEGVYEAASSHDTLCGGDHRKGAVKLRRQPPPQPPAQRAVSLRTLRTSACGGDVNLFCCTLRILDISFRSPSAQPAAAGGHDRRRSGAPFFDPAASRHISYCEHCLFPVYYRNEKVTGG